VCVAWPFFYVSIVAAFQDAEQDSPGCLLGVRAYVYACMPEFLLACVRSCVRVGDLRVPPPPMVFGFCGYLCVSEDAGCLVL
jgi:hypothetical protein